MSHRQEVFVQGDFSEPMSAQHNFADQFDLENPGQAMSVYARIMHQHTKNQLQTATNSARRRSGESDNAPSLHNESSLSSVSSTAS